MVKRLLRPATTQLRACGARLGHEAVWLLIAVLFCAVEAAVRVSELPLPLWRGLQRLRRLSLAPAGRSESSPRRAFAG